MYTHQKIIIGISATILLVMIALVYRKHQCNWAIEQQSIAYDKVINSDVSIFDQIAIAKYRKNVCGD